MYVTEELRTYHDQITGVMNRNTMVLRLRNVKFLISPTVCMPTFKTEALHLVSNVQSLLL